MNITKNAIISETSCSFICGFPETRKWGTPLNHPFRNSTSALLVFIYGLPCLGMCESSFLRLEYSVELLMYSSTRLIPEVAIHYRVVTKQTETWFLIVVFSTTAV